MVGKSTWFAKSKSSHTGQAKPTLALRSIKRSRVPDKIESVMFIPYTPQSALKKQLQETEKAINGRSKVGIIRMIERSGPTMGQLLYNKHPWSKDPCGRRSCKPCEFKPGSCRRSNITYRLQCLECKSTGVKSTYIGESNRLFFDRSKEHEAALRSRNQTYAVVKHWEEVHPKLTSPPKYSYTFLKTHKTAFDRQVWEGDYQSNSIVKYC